MTRFIHTSDWQLGMTRAFLSHEASARFSQARIDAIANLARLAEEHHAQFMVVAGDVFESNQISRQTLLRTMDALAAFPVPVFLLPGNHDPLDGASIYSTEHFRTAAKTIVVLGDQRPVPVPGCQGVEIVGAPWFTKRPTHDLCAEMTNALEPSQDITRIGVCHGQVDTLSPDPDRPETISLSAAEQAIAQGKIHYLALGDRHSLTAVGNTGRVHYSGAPVATAFDETDPNQCLLVDLNADHSCEVKGLKSGHWNFISHDVEINGTEDLNQFENWLKQLPGKETCVVKVGFRGSVNLQTRARLDALMDEQASVFASLKQRQRTSDLAVVPDQLDHNSVALAGYAKQSWDILLRQSQHSDPDTAQQAQDALRLFFRLNAGNDPA